MKNKCVRPAHLDPDNSVDLFDSSRKNEFGETYCVAPAILIEQVDQYWDDYAFQAYKVVARNAGFIGTLVYDNDQHDHTGFQYRPTVQDAANDIKKRTDQTQVEIINQVSNKVTLGAMANSSPQWYG